MKNFSRWGVLMIMSLGLTGTAFADTARENETLARIVTVLDSLKPLINEAELQHDPRDREVFVYQDLRADIEKVKHGIVRKFNQTLRDPHVVEPIKGDYVVLKSKQRG